jgi:hypothetical protein
MHKTAVFTPRTMNTRNMFFSEHTWARKRLTHLVVSILALSPRANERINPRLDAITEGSMKLSYGASSPPE